MNPARLKPYIKANELRRSEHNYQAWLQGLYIYNAVAVAVANNFGKKKYNYLEEPIAFTQEEADASYLRKEAKWKAQMKAFAERMNNGTRDSEN